MHILLDTTVLIWALDNKERLSETTQGVLTDPRDVVLFSAAGLPLHHRDPFDRLLVAQAMAEPAVLFTPDRQLTAYSADLVVAL